MATWVDPPEIGLLHGSVEALNPNAMRDLGRAVHNTIAALAGKIGEHVDGNAQAHSNLSSLITALDASVTQVAKNLEEFKAAYVADLSSVGGIYQQQQASLNALHHQVLQDQAANKRQVEQYDGIHAAIGQQMAALRAHVENINLMDMMNAFRETHFMPLASQVVTIAQ